MVTTPIRPHLLSKNIYRNTNECQSSSNTRNDTPNKFSTCRLPPRNKKVSHTKRENILNVRERVRSNYLGDEKNDLRFVGPLSMSIDDVPDHSSIVNDCTTQHKAKKYSDAAPRCSNLRSPTPADGAHDEKDDTWDGSIQTKFRFIDVIVASGEPPC